MYRNEGQTKRNLKEILLFDSLAGEKGDDLERGMMKDNSDSSDEYSDFIDQYAIDGTTTNGDYAFNHNEYNFMLDKLL